MKRTLRARGVLLTAIACLTLGGTACGSAASRDAASPGAGSAAPAKVATSATVLAPDRPFGAGCAAVSAAAPGSMSAMAHDPVVLAASRNPVLSSFVINVQRANLADPFNSQQAITVLLPVNQAFTAVPAPSLHRLLSDTATLTQVLTHHVIPGRLTPGELVGTHTTLDNDTVTITASGAVFTVGAGQTVAGTKAATVICGNVQTANATLYMIDGLLKPPAS
ncbi:MAG: Secreted/surface protein with fasciclin-like repeat [Blastococcus sp.]|nr:Secreted/surface protein with fasciclin-like repeat [Blastococcus sp.]